MESEIIFNSIILSFMILAAFAVSPFIYSRIKEEWAIRSAEINMSRLFAYDDVIASFADILEMKSGESGKHVKRVSEYTAALCRYLKLPPERIHDISVASMMHDVGKLLVPNEILEKSGKLSEEEFQQMKLHVSYGDRILAETDENIMRTAWEIAGQHHERWDGSGYMTGRKGKEIALSARIVSVADVFDALTSRRSYKDAWSTEDARAEILAQSGRQFDPEIVEAFEACYDEFLRIRREYAD